MWGAEPGVHGEGLVVWGAQRGVCGMGHQAVVGRDMPHRTRCTGCCTRCQAAGVGYATGATLCRPPGFRRSGGGVEAARHAAGQAVLLDGAHLALSPQAMVGARAGYTGFPCTLRPFCSSHPRSQPVASQPEEHPRILLLALLWGLQLAWLCLTSSPPEAGPAFPSPRQHRDLLQSLLDLISLPADATVPLPAKPALHRAPSSCPG